MTDRLVVSVRNPNDGAALDVKLADAATASNQRALLAELRALNALVPVDYDAVELEYDGEDLTQVTFARRGVVSCTITLTWVDHKLKRVTKK